MDDDGIRVNEAGDFLEEYYENSDNKHYFEKQPLHRIIDQD